MRGIYSTLLLLFLVISTSAFAQQTSAPLPVVRFVVPPYQDSLVVTFGNEKGWFKEEGLDVRFTLVGLDEVQETLASGSVDVAWSTTTNTMVASIKNPDLVFVYPWNTFDNGFALVARPNGAIQTIDNIQAKFPNHADAVKAAARQLSGKTIITTSHTDMEQAVASVAERGGLAFGKDVKIVNLPPDEGLAAFLSGVGDAYMGGIPQRTRAVKEGMVEVIRGLDLGPAPINGLVTTRKYLASHKSEILKIMKVWFRIASFGNSNTDELGTFIVTSLNHSSGANFTLSDFRGAWNGLEHFVDSPQYAQRDVFDPSGPNYWLTRWNDDNKYFHTIIKSIPHTVSPTGLFQADEMQKEYIGKYGDH